MSRILRIAALVGAVWIVLSGPRTFPERLAAAPMQGELRSNTTKIEEMLEEAYILRLAQEPGRADSVLVLVLESAASHLREAETRDPHSLETAHVLDLIVRARITGGRGREPETLELAERALATKEHILPSDALGLVPSLVNLGRVHNASQFASAGRGIPSLRRALAIMVASGDSTKLDFPRVLYSLGSAHALTEQPLQAKPYLMRATAIWEQSFTEAEKRDDHEEAKRLALEIARINLPSVLEMLAEFPESTRGFERCIQITQRFLGPDNKGLAYLQMRVGTLYSLLGDHDAARKFYEESLANSERCFGPEHGQTMQILGNYGEWLLKSGDLQGARRLLERQFEARTSDPWRQWAGRCHLAELEIACGNDERARPLLERALVIADSLQGSHHLFTPHGSAWNMELLAGVLGRAGHDQRAIALYEHTIAICEQSLGPKSPELVSCLTGLASLEDSRSEEAHARELAVRAESIGREHLRLLASSLPERLALDYASARPGALDLLLSMASRSHDSQAVSAAWDARIRSRALVLDEMAERHQAVISAQDPEATALATRLMETRRRLAYLSLRGGESDRAVLEELQREKEAAESALAKASSTFREQQRRDGAGLAEVLAFLPPGSALVAFSRFEDRRGMQLASTADESYLVFVLRTGGASPKLIALGRAAEIDSLVSRWGAGVSRPPAAKSDLERACRVAGESLRQRVWDPIVSHIEGSTRVFVVPDGALHLVNLAALPVGETEYLVERGPMLHFLSAERDLLRPSMEAGKEGLLALGGPDFDARATGEVAMEAPASAAVSVYRGERTGCVDFRTQRFEALPGAKQEALEIGALWPGPVTHLTGSDASESAFKALAPQHRVLHVATHGFFLGGRCRSALDSARGLGGVTGPGAAPFATTSPRHGGDNPLLLSGLVLQGANRRDEAGADDEDGILTAEEIASLDLRGVEWAVLSACETGVGEVRSGEGVLGLRRAFEVAGARSLIMSLWGVDDEATRQWMRKLYEARFLRGASTDEAVRAACLEILADRRARGQTTHPFYWGAFVAAGDWR